MAMERDLLDAKEALGPLDHHAGLVKGGKNLSEVVYVLSLAAAVNQDVIEVYKDARDAAEDSVHKVLEGLSRVLEAKRHPEELPETKWCYDGSLLDVVGCHGDLVVAAVQDKSSRKWSSPPGCC